MITARIRTISQPFNMARVILSHCTPSDVFATIAFWEFHVQPVLARYQPHFVIPSTLKPMSNWFWRLLLLLAAPTLCFADGAITNVKVMSFNIWVNGGTSLTRCID